jgi:hypothetical protein
MRWKKEESINARRLVKIQKGGRRENSIKHLFPGRPRSSNEEAVEESALCHDEENSEHISNLSHKLNTDLAKHIQSNCRWILVDIDYKS